MKLKCLRCEALLEMVYAVPTHIVILSTLEEQNASKMPEL